MTAVGSRLRRRQQCGTGDLPIHPRPSHTLASRCSHVPLIRQRHAQVATVFEATARFRPRDRSSSQQHP